MLGASLAACGAGAPLSATTPQPGGSPAPTATATFAPFPSASGSPPFTPPAVGVTPEPTGVSAGSPPVTYAVPSGYSLDLSTSTEVDLTSANGAEKLSFGVDTSIEDLSHPVSTMNIAGEIGYVVDRGSDAGGYGYEEVVIVHHDGTQYEAECIGYSGYDASLLTSGCGTFLGSLAFAR